MKKILTLATVIATMGLGHAQEGTQSLSFEQFKEACTNPESYGHQNPPTKIRLQCKNRLTAWEPVESGVTSLPESREVVSELFSNKYTVASDRSGVRVPERRVMCPRLREMVRTASVELSLTCDQILNDQRDLQDRCLEELDSAIAANGDIVQSEATGAIYSVCGEGQGGKAPQGDDSSSDEE